MKYTPPKWKPAAQIKEERLEAKGTAHRSAPKYKIEGMLEVHGKISVWLKCLSCNHTYFMQAHPDLATFKTPQGRNFLANMCLRCEYTCPCNPLNHKPARNDMLISEFKVTE